MEEDGLWATGGAEEDSPSYSPSPITYLLPIIISTPVKLKTILDSKAEC